MISSNKIKTKNRGAAEEKRISFLTPSSGRRQRVGKSPQGEKTIATRKRVRKEDESNCYRVRKNTARSIKAQQQQRGEIYTSEGRPITMAWKKGVLQKRGCLVAIKGEKGVEFI